MGSRSQDGSPGNESSACLSSSKIQIQIGHESQRRQVCRVSDNAHVHAPAYGCGDAMTRFDGICIDQSIWLFSFAWTGALNTHFLFSEAVQPVPADGVHAFR